MKRTRAATAVANQVSAVIVMLACCCLGGTSASAIDCLSAAGDPKTGWYSWREIDGRKCWFLKTGAMPAKSELRWPAKVRQEARAMEPLPPPERNTEPPVAVAAVASSPVAVMPPPSNLNTSEESPPPSQLRFKTARVKPAAAPATRLGHGLDLLNGVSLWGNSPANLAPADPFHARFVGGKD